jgi:peptidyl-prolyl cis-trans isomerase C
MRTGALVGIALTVFIVGVGVGRLWSSWPAASSVDAPDAGFVLARWDGGTLREADLQFELTDLGPQGRARYKDEAARNDLVSSLARSAVLADDARLIGLEKDPDVMRRQRESLAAELVKQQFEQRVSAEPTPAEIEAWYHAHLDTFSQQQTIHAAYILLKSKPQAEALLRDVQQKSTKDYYAFSNAAHEKSEDAQSRLRGGELSPMTPQALEHLLGTTAVAALKMLKPGEIAPSIIETPEGFQIVRLLDAREASTAPFDTVRESIAQQLRAEKKKAAWTKFVADVEVGFSLSIDKDAVHNFVVR